jgi:quinol monooxygenase YgiN
MNATVAVLGTLKFPPEKVPHILPHLMKLLAASRLHDGCIAYNAAIDIAEPGVIRISETWSDQLSLQRHIDNPDVPPWHAAARDCSLIESEYFIFDVSGIRIV